MLVLSTYRLGSVKHADAEVPQTKTPVFSHATETIVSLIASPRVKGNG
jgi:hypothetical protein